MKESEYEEKLRALKAEHRKQIRALQAEYLKANNQVEHGDIVVSDVGTMIHVDKMRVSRFFEKREIPAIEYEGVQLTKGGRPFKRGTRETVYGPRVAKIIKRQEEKSDGSGEYKRASE